MAFDPNSPLQSHVGLSDIAQIKENFNQLRKCEASATEPGNLVAGVFWYDTTTDILKLRNKANTAWQNIWDFANAKVGVDGVQSTSIKAGTTAVVVSANDTTKGYLNGKLTAGTGITLTENGDGGAETLSVALASSSVSQSLLKSTTANGSLLVQATTAGTYSLTGGTYSWWTASATTAPSGYLTFGNGNTAAGAIGLYNSSGSENTFYVDERYIQASPPYHMGPLFAFLVVDKSGNIVMSSTAPDPPWAYHGPTNITPEYYTANGTPCRDVAYIGDKRLCDMLPMEILTAEDEITYRQEIITLDYKDSDKNIIPHPFLGNNLSGKTVIMLEPGTSLMDRLYLCLCEQGAKTVGDMVRNNDIRFDNSFLDMKHTPSAVKVVKAKLR